MNLEDLSSQYLSLAFEEHELMNYFIIGLAAFILGYEVYGCFLKNPLQKFNEKRRNSREKRDSADLEHRPDKHLPKH